MPSSSGRSDPTTSSTASAPAALASYSWYGSTVKSLRRIGRSVAARASARSASEPPKFASSVRIETAAAPPLS